METPAPFESHTLLRCADRPGGFLPSRASEVLLTAFHPLQIGIVNDVNARRVDHPVMAIIAGAAPTAHLLGELEKKGIQPVHVYGLTYVLSAFIKSRRHAETAPSLSLPTFDQRGDRTYRS